LVSTENEIKKLLDVRKMMKSLSAFQVGERKRAQLDCVLAERD